MAAMSQQLVNGNHSKKLNTRYKQNQGCQDEKRKDFLERNRQAALKCRQRKKEWLNNLQAKVELLTNDNVQLQIQANVMRDEVISLRNLLLIHKNCPSTTKTIRL